MKDEEERLKKEKIEYEKRIKEEKKRIEMENEKKKKLQLELEEKKRRQREENEQREKQLLDELKKREDEIKAAAEKENAKKLQQYEEQRLRELKEENERKENEKLRLEQLRKERMKMLEEINKESVKSKKSVNKKVSDHKSFEVKIKNRFDYNTKKISHGQNPVVLNEDTEYVTTEYDSNIKEENSKIGIGNRKYNTAETPKNSANFVSFKQNNILNFNPVNLGNGVDEISMDYYSSPSFVLSLTYFIYSLINLLNASYMIFFTNISGNYFTILLFILGVMGGIFSLLDIINKSKKIVSHILNKSHT